MKWIKASERLPSERKQYCVRQIIHGSLCYSVDYFGGTSNFIEFDNMDKDGTDFEWLDETPSPAPLDTQGEDKEFIVCSAIEYFRNIDVPIIVCGLRHNGCISTYYNITGNFTGDEVQGFLTSKNRFVNRIEGGKIALACGQIKELKYYGGKMLDSSDLYHTIFPTPSPVTSAEGMAEAIWKEYGTILGKVCSKEGFISDFNNKFLTGFTAASKTPTP